MGKLTVIVISVVAPLGSNAAIAQNNQTETPAAKAVARCVNVVHNTHPQEESMATFYRNFDAFYNPNTGEVQNNATTVGDQKAVFVFEKCMTQQGYPLGPKHQ